MSKLVMMRGLPASGKSTRAKEIVDGGGNFIRVNRDLLREMLHFSKWSGKNEGITETAERALVRGFLRGGANLVVDDCNLGDKHLQMWKGVAEEEGAKFEMVEMDTPPQECVVRDASREKKVGRDVIMRMAMQYQRAEFPNGIIVCDVDGTIADINHRVPILYNGETDRTKFKDYAGKKNWKDFFAQMSNDVLRQDVADKLIKDAEEANASIVFVSARGMEWEKETVEWLDKNLPFKYTTIIMRQQGDRRDDEIVKREIYERFLKHYKIVKVFDDRPRVVRMWKELGLDVEDCGDGIEF